MLGVVFGLLFADFFLGVFGQVVSTALGMGRAMHSWFPVVLMAPLVVALIVGGVHVARSGLPIIRRERAWYQVALFARRNQMTFARRGPAPDYPGLLFRRGTSRRRNQYLTPVDARGAFHEAGQMQWDQGGDESTQTVHRNYAVFRLPRPVPHLVVDSLADGRLEVGAARVLDRRQEVPLSGDFARLYSLHAPDGYGAEAMQIFSPDVVAALVDEPLAFDLELVGEWAVLYGADSLELADPQTWQRIAAFEDHVLARLLRTTGRYVDRSAAAAPALTWGGDRVVSTPPRPAELNSRMSSPARLLIAGVLVVVGSAAVSMVAFWWLFSHLH